MHGIHTISYKGNGIEMAKKSAGLGRGFYDIFNDNILETGGGSGATLRSSPSKITTGISESPAILAALQRRSPAIIS